MSGEKLLAQMDATLDQLITNAEAMKMATKVDFSCYEVEAMQKTQESLLANLSHLQETIEEKMISPKKNTKREMQQKLQKFQKLNTSFIKGLSRKWGPIRVKKRK